VKSPPGKTGYYFLEGLGSFATAYFFNYLLQRLRREYGFTDLQTLGLCALHGFLYIPLSWYGGRFGQRHGYFTSLRVGFGGMFLGVVLPGMVPALWAQVAGVALWTMAMCFTWPMLEALVSEHEPADRLPRRVGFYNFIWAVTAAAGVFFGGSLYKFLGASSLYWLSAVIHLGQWIATYPLQRRHDTWVARQPAPDLTVPKTVAATEAARPAYFLRLAWIGNPFNYMAINTVLAIVPALAGRLGLEVDQVGWLMSLWFIVRAAAFVILALWPGWHYRFGWFASALLMLLVGFVAIVTARHVWVLVLAQIAFGWATALLYYSSLFYAMDGSDTKGAHGGIHEAFIGCGIFGGPAIGALSVAATGDPLSPAWAVGTFLAGGLGLAWWIRRRGLAAG
jgi:predicted MFS family arabinose efflux permease